MASLRRLIGNSLTEEERRDFLQGLYECSACGQCHVVCPVRINTPELWEQARQSLVNTGFPQPEGQITQLENIKKFNNSLGKPQKDRGRWARIAAQAGFILEPLPLPNEGSPDVLYFAGCTASFDPDTQPVAVQSALLLQQGMVRFSILGNEEPCCVSKLRRMGDPEYVSEAKDRVNLFVSRGIKTVVVSCAGCYKGFHSDSRGLWPEGYRVLHLTQYLSKLISEGGLQLRHRVPMVVTYHDPCHLGRHNGIYDEPRHILQSIRGLTLVEMTRHKAFSTCCGMGGGLKAANPEIQRKMSASRIREAEATGAQAVVTPCQTCYLGLMHGVEETGSSLEVYHLNEMLIRAVCPEATWERIKRAFSAVSP